MSTTPEQGFTFTEAPLPYGRTGVAISIRVDEIQHDERSDYGRIQVFATPFFGRMLVIDGIIQTTEVDEFIYHEMLVLPPSLAFGRPASLLIIGGGDGGALRQAVKVSSLHRIIAVDIDPVVTEVSRRYLPTVSGGAFADPRVQLLHADGAQYVQECSERFDVVVLDLTDPVSGGPAEALFDEPFLRQVQRVLTPGGVMAMQCGSLVFQPDEVRQTHHRLASIFATTRLHAAMVPSYQLGLFGFLLASDRQLAEPQQLFTAGAPILHGPLQFLTADVLTATALLPAAHGF